MPIIASAGKTKNFTPCPEGMHQICCVDILDNGIKATPYGDKHKVTIRWQTEEGMSDGKPYLLQKQYTLSLNEKATLRKDLESWRGRPFTEDEADAFDLEKLLGANGLANVSHHKDAKGNIWANVLSLTPTLKGMPKISPRDYVRVVERPTTPEASQQEEAEFETRDEDPIPF